MNDHDANKEIKELLQQAVAPAKDAELRRDLWPQMLRKLEAHPAHMPHVPWFDWALAVLAGAALLFFPGIIPAVFYHL
ncbi:MAG TPA: hypothetical protein VJN42_00470 [Candidatus Acidoferrum sp.]|nr:hypothetical protein [Candidatus Acidoferrum sp.]